MSDLETLKAQHPCIEGVLKVYVDVGPDGCSQRERAMVDLLALVQHHEATIAERDAQIKKIYEHLGTVASDLAIAQAELEQARYTIQQQARELEEVDLALIAACDVDRDPNDPYLAEAYRAALARHSARAQQAEAKQEEK